jgi:hypothetical protein
MAHTEFNRLIMKDALLDGRTIHGRVMVERSMKDETLSSKIRILVEFQQAAMLRRRPSQLDASNDSSLLGVAPHQEAYEQSIMECGRNVEGGGS